MGALRAAPRRFRMRTASSPREVPRPRRSAAHDVSAAACGGRNSTASTALPSAASCRRRSSEYLMLPGHASSAPQAWERSACSVAHSVSRGLRVVTMMMCARSMPAAASAGAYGRCGGAIHTMVRFCADSAASAHPSMRSSPMPACAGMISVSAAVGQPPPGSSASSAAKPVGTLALATRLNSLPRQMAGWLSNVASAFTAPCRCGSRRPRCPRFRTACGAGRLR